MTVERAKEMLPNVPDDIFDIFLSTLISEGPSWPFHTLDDSLQGTQWLGIFDPFTLKEFSEFQWNLTSIEISPAILYQRSWQDIKIVHDIFEGEPDPRLPQHLVSIHRDKLQQQIYFIEENRCVSAPVIVAHTPEGKLKIFDGVNRILGLFIINGFVSQSVPAWVGTITAI